MVCPALPIETTKDAIVGMQIVQIVANAQHAMVALDATGKRFGNAGFRERAFEKCRALRHACAGIASRRKVGIGGIITTVAGYG